MKFKNQARTGKLTRRFSPVFSLLLLFAATTLHAQRVTTVFQFEPDFSGIQTALATAPAESNRAAHTGAPVIELPDPNGTPLALRAVETQLLAPDFAARYPDFKTYALSDPQSGVYRGQLFVSRFGLQALLFTDAGACILRPLDRNNPELHEVFFEETEGFDCATDNFTENEKPGGDNKESAMPPNGATTRTYRIAIVTTGEYYTGNGNTTPLADAAVTTDVNNLAAIYKRELAVDFLLLSPAHYTDPATDPFFPDESNGINRALQAAAVVGANFAVADYDVGQALHKGSGGGYAFFFSVCSSIALPDPDGAGSTYTTGGHRKGRGWSGSFSNQNLSFARLFAHEVGHMFNARHTFNGSGSNCTSSNIDPSSSYEIGSGTTIMSYRDICSASQNVPSSGAADDYFHSKSLEQILAYIATTSCALTAASGNAPPTVSANPCNQTLTIPKLTPFTLTGSGSDPDGDTVFFCWEQIDEDGAGTPTQGFIGTTAGNSPIAPLFRSYPPTTSPKRTFPNWPFILNNANAADFEALPNTARTLNFRLQARDFKPFGAIDHSNVAVTVSSSAGPLTVTAPNTNVSWAEGSTQTVTWEVNSTDALAANVNILLSIDGGYNYPYVLASGTPNDGSHTVTLPSILPASTTARIMVQCVVNDCLSFFDVSDVNFTITSSCLAPANTIYPTAAATFVEGDPGLDLSFFVLKSAPAAATSFVVNSADPLMNKVRWNNNFSACMTPGGTNNYEVFPFIASISGQYSFSFGSGNFRAIHLFKDAFDPFGGCTNFVASSVQDGAGYYSIIPNGAMLTAGTPYFLIGTNEAFSGNTTVTFGGPGVFNEILTIGGDYAYTYAAVNTANNQIEMVDAGANFISLPPGDYHIYGLAYKASGAPPLVDPSTFIDQTITDILNAGNCVYFSSGFKPLTVTPSPGSMVINEVDYDQEGTDTAEFIELKNTSNAAINLAGWTIELVDGAGAGATVYQTIALPNVQVAPGDYFVVCGDNSTVPNCDFVNSIITDFIQNGAPDAIGLRENGILRDAVSYEGNTAAPYTEGTGVTPGDSGTGSGQGISRFPDGSDTDDNNVDFVSNVCITPGASNVNTSLSISSLVTPVSCFGGADGSIALSVTGGTTPYSYQWSNGQATATAINLTAGTYTATVTDANGCSATASATVTQPPALTVSAAANPAACFGEPSGSIALTVGGGTMPYGYLWSNGQTTATAVNLTAGTYTATITDANGCTATASATVTQPPALTVSAAANPVACFGGNSGSVALTVGGGATPYGYLWSNGQTTATAVNLTAGTYTATITDANGCTKTSSATVTEPPALLLGTGSTPESCTPGNDGTASANPSGGTPPYSYLWNTGQTTATISGLSAGVYTVTATDAANCTATATATVSQGVGDELLARAAAKVFLQGPYVSSVQLMHDSLRVRGVIPLSEPYTGLTNFTHTGGGGGEQTTAAVLAVTGPNAIVDWVFLELRSAADPALVVATRSALLQRDGDVVDMDGVSPVAFGISANASFYLAVRHRNHLGVQLGEAVFYPVCDAVETDFRTLPPEGFYENNGLNPAQKLVSGKYTLWAGNGRIDFQLKYNGSNNDRTTVLAVVGLNTPNAIVPGYLLSDYNLDGVVKYNGSANDRNVVLGNVGITTPLAIVYDQVGQ